MKLPACFQAIYGRFNTWAYKMYIVKFLVSYYIVLLIYIYSVQTSNYMWLKLPANYGVCVSPSMTISIIYVALNYLWGSETGSGRFYMATLQILYQNPTKQKPSRSMVRADPSFLPFDHQFYSTCLLLDSGRPGTRGGLPCHFSD